ncbi:Homocitrate dehydratase, mitochondrial [Sesbania bispinosa]|nr:Homocitrate dehydratase, mitochondrial [Sesbania bispinosa]
MAFITPFEKIAKVLGKRQFLMFPNREKGIHSSFLFFTLTRKSPSLKQKLRIFTPPLPKKEQNNSAMKEALNVTPLN